MKDLKYLFAFTIPLTVFLSIYYKGPFSFTTLVYAYGVIPCLLYTSDAADE